MGNFLLDRLRDLAVFAVDDRKEFGCGYLVDSCGGRVRLFRQQGIKRRHTEVYQGWKTPKPQPPRRWLTPQFHLTKEEFQLDRGRLGRIGAMNSIALNIGSKPIANRPLGRFG